MRIYLTAISSFFPTDIVSPQRKPNIPHMQRPRTHTQKEKRKWEDQKEEE